MPVKGGSNFNELLEKELSKQNEYDNYVPDSNVQPKFKYIPKKKTIVALAIALRLNLDDTRDLLNSAGLALTNNSKADLIVRFCLENGIYDIFEVNALLFKFGQPTLG